MNLKKKIFVLSIFIIFISICGIYSMNNPQNTDALPLILNETDESGCCSVVLQLDGNDTIMSYRRDANLTADIYIEQVDWHGHPAIKQYKTENGYFNHVIVTNDGWIVGLGGIDDGEDNERCEKIASEMISDDNSISQYALQQIQDIKKPYKKGHIIIKAPNGNYGFATDEKIKTGKLNPGEYISMPNKYEFSRKGNVALNSSDKIRTMVELAQSDLYGLNRRDVFVYDFHIDENGNTIDIFLSNDDGSRADSDTKDSYDDVLFNNTKYEGSKLPLGPNYEQIGSVTYEHQNSNFENLLILLLIVGFVVFVGILFFIVLKLVRSVKRNIRR